MKECHWCGEHFPDKEDFCPHCGIENFSDLESSKSGISAKEKERLGAWILTCGFWNKDTNPPLYTEKCADVIRHKATGKKYRRGKYVLFHTNKAEEKPTLIEDTGEYEFIYHGYHQDDEKYKRIK